MKLTRKLHWLVLCCITCIGIVAGLLTYNWHIEMELERYQQSANDNKQNEKSAPEHLLDQVPKR